MPELSPVTVGVAAALFVLLEVGLFWAAASLGDAPMLTWLKTVPVSVGVAAVWVVLVGVAAWQSGVGRAPLAPENRGVAVLVGCIGLAVMWAIPAILYAPLLPVSLFKSMRIAVFQVALRAFAYVLLGAAAMVALAVWQIWAGADVRAALLP